ncbi:MAG: hypothetical protein A2521_06725 [Deltaproteobacteria bacterium RIFOXYD12_FULL_57_12]|nr:MAG: hypothetical protein A2521_06725 [Deltaproteobacteria bacterium RIFOXYD12_FULL_57_12]
MNKEKNEAFTQYFEARGITKPIEGWKSINSKRLINSLNRLDFQNGYLTINLKHPRYKKNISLNAKPRPCVDANLDCQWEHPQQCPPGLGSYELISFFLTDGLHQIFVEPQVREINQQGVQLVLPETCYEISSRKNRRHHCNGVQAQISQNGVVFFGRLMEFSSVSMKIDIAEVPVSLLHKINPSLPVNIILVNNEDSFYSGQCTLHRHGGGRRKSMVVSPVADRIQRFLPKEYRSIRQKLTPSPSLVFLHPCTGRKNNLRMVEMSGCGFSVEEESDNAVLLPGMILSDIELEIAGFFRVGCVAQVIYSNKNDESGVTSCGLAILDMEVKDQIRLSSLLHQANDCNTYVCSVSDLEALWEFFFETGFVYPEKYAVIQTQRDRFKALYEKLYVEHPEIAINFTYQDKGKIYGHMAMCRVYSRTWMIHHHAAISSGRKAGLLVLEQVSRYINEFHRLHSTHMDFVSCYFRPDNKFPNLVFGGLAKKSKDPKGCSVDSFAYFHYKKAAVQQVFSNGWTLSESGADDLMELEDFYEDISGGLMIDALDLGQEMLGHDELDRDYLTLGLKRQRHLYSLKKNGELKAVIMVNVSDIGLNMSDLTNCFHVIVLDSEEVGADELYYALFRLSHHYEHDNIPVLIYPAAYADAHSLPSEKIYNLWVLNINQHSDYYFRHLEKLLRRVQ